MQMSTDEAKQKILDLSRQQEYEINLAKRSNTYAESKGTARLAEKRVIQLEKEIESLRKFLWSVLL